MAHAQSPDVRAVAEAINTGQELPPDSHEMSLALAAVAAQVNTLLRRRPYAASNCTLYLVRSGPGATRGELLHPSHPMFDVPVGATRALERHISGSIQEAIASVRLCGVGLVNVNVMDNYYVMAVRNTLVHLFGGCLHTSLLAGCPAHLHVACLPACPATRLPTYPLRPICLPVCCPTCRGACRLAAWGVRHPAVPAD
jgi:hypothetical protein